MSRSIHRDDDSDEHRPACREGLKDADFTEVHISSHLPFNRWSLCEYPECFGEEAEDVDRGDGIETDGGKSASDTYRVKTVNPGANTRATTWVRALSRRDAEQHVREILNRHFVESCLQRKPPADADVIEVGQ